MSKIKPLISVLIVNFNSSDFIKLSLFSLKSLTKNPYQVFILDNGSKKSDFCKLQKSVQVYKNVFLERKETNERGSVAHGKGLDYLVKKVNTPYFCILDADCVWLKKNWDAILIGKINKKVKIVGTQAPPPKPQDFPLMFACLLETPTFRKLQVRFKPKSIANYKDTGFEMREKYFSSGFSGMNLKMRNTRSFKNGPFNKLICAEYYLGGVKQIFASHFGRGSTKGIGKYINSTDKLFFPTDAIRYIFAKIRGYNEMTKWKIICKEIINDQL